MNSAYCFVYFLLKSTAFVGKLESEFIGTFDPIYMEMLHQNDNIPNLCFQET